MKKYLLLILIAYSCSEQEVKPVRTFGGEGDPDADYRTMMAKGRKPKPTPVDTQTKPPVDTVTKPPVDTVVTPPPAPLPTSYSLWMPPVKNQGSEGACHSFAAAWARYSEHYYKTGQQLTPSPEYMFNQVKTATTCNSSTLLGNLWLLQSNGVCRWETMPYTWTGCTTMPVEYQHTEAAGYKISSFVSIPISDIQAIKKAISEKHPLVIQIAADQQFLDAKPGFVWSTFSGTMGYHGVVICGYDDSKQAVKIINSWGTAWGDAGYCWISYSLLPTVSSSAFKMIL